MKVLVCDKISDEGLKILKDAGLEVDVKTGMSPEEVAGVIAPYHAVIVRSATKIRKPAIEAGTNLRAIARGGVGLDNIDVDFAKEKGIRILNTPGATAISVAELTAGMMLCLCRPIPRADASMKAEKWEKKKFMGTELYGKTLGVVGTGQIGLNVIRIARGFRMDIIACDIVRNEEMRKELGFSYVDMAELLARSDVITIHVPLMSATRHMINAETIAKMKDGVLIINCARGGVVNEKDLVEALKSGKVGGAGIDVYEKEPTDNKELLALDNVVLTPHLGASAREGQLRVAVEICEKVVNVLR